MQKTMHQLDVHEDAFEILAMPDVRVIGTAHRCTFNPDETPWQAIWAAYGAARDAIDALPRVFENGMICWLGDAPIGGGHYTYMPAVICPAGTPVPEGLDFRDLPATLVAKGMYGDDLDAVVRKLTALGYRRRYTDISTDLGWDAELYAAQGLHLSATDDPLRWMVPCVEVD